MECEVFLFMQAQKLFTQFFTQTINLLDGVLDMMF